MTVFDFQKCLRALADVISTKAPARELVEAADALTPFAGYRMEAFATFLKLVEAKYGATGELPDGSPPKPPRAERPTKGAAPKSPAPTVDELVAAVEELKVRLRTDPDLTKDGVAAALRGFDRLTQPDLYAGVRRLGMRAKPKSKGDALAMIVNHTVAAQGGVERSDA